MGRTSRAFSELTLYHGSGGNLSYGNDISEEKFAEVEALATDARVEVKPEAGASTQKVKNDDGYDTLTAKSTNAKGRRSKKNRHQPIVISKAPLLLQDVGGEEDGKDEDSGDPEGLTDLLAFLLEDANAQTVTRTSCLRNSSLKSTDAEKQAIYWSDNTKIFRASVANTQAEEEIHYEESINELDLSALHALSPQSRSLNCSIYDESGTFDVFHDDLSEVEQHPVSQRRNSLRARLSELSEGFYGSTIKDEDGTTAAGETLPSGGDSFRKPRVRRSQLTKKSSLLNMIIGSMRNVAQCTNDDIVNQEKSADTPEEKKSQQHQDIDVDSSNAAVITKKKTKKTLFKNKSSRQDDKDVALRPNAGITSNRKKKKKRPKRHEQLNLAGFKIEDINSEDINSDNKTRALMSSKKGFSSIVKNRLRGGLDVNYKTDVTASDLSIDFSIMKHRESEEKISFILNSR